jgi:hypothetical protein
MVEGNIVLLQPGSCAIVRSSQIPLGADDDLPLIPLEPLHELNAARARAGLPPALKMDFETAIGIAGAEEIAGFRIPVADLSQVLLECSLG